MAAEVYYFFKYKTRCTIYNLQMLAYLVFRKTEKGRG